MRIVSYRSSHIVRLRSNPMEIDAMKGANSDLTGSIIAFAEAHFREEICSEGIAEDFGISREYVCRIVKGNTGFTVVEFLHRMRIEEAKRLLRESKDCIYLIDHRIAIDLEAHRSVTQYQAEEDCQQA